MPDVSATRAARPMSLPAATPESMGIPSGALSALVERLERLESDPHALAVARHGRVVARGAWAPYRLEDATLVYSLSKTFLAAAVAFAVEEGLMDLDAPIAQYFPEVEAPGRSAQMRVRDLLSMATGHEEDLVEPIFGPDPVAGLLAREPEHEPGTVFTYNQSGPFLLSAAITRLTGQRVGEYLRPRLFEPLGIGPRWWTQAGEADLGFTGLHARVGDILALGQTLLDGGSFGGARVLPEGWVDLASSVHIPTSPRPSPPDWQQGYGFLMWRSRHGFRADGACGQLCLVLPDEGLVVALTSATDDLQAELDAVWETLLPALAPASLAEDAPAQAALAQELARAEIPLAPASSNTPFAHGTMRPDGAGWTVDVDGLSFGVGSDDWRRTLVPVGSSVLPIAAQGRATGDGGWEATAVVTSSPHRMLLRALPGSSVVEVRWHVPPLRSDDLRLLAAPEWAAGE
ncbi:CubicO group peptidase, beta-lactamase class C family [Sanguibacter gelidistatuariae]|uniref:CubicO group peptidase, beta-lactamase class C family n=1 Tax=Sanguibacter gelidistatuariae TaxID=1814289 RepID=A0A1G6UH73_9MICO|nr:serine hydrolase [Sanguibacter gelidistatuariae]SDD40066.1 CubicO group peptidase, beta-lactamase class C family [Sanguibacter gelidistatuariae]